jgi:hypothetical protein
VPIFSICDEQLGELARRKKAISYRIAVQRAQLGEEMQRLRGPLESLDRAREAAARVIANLPVIVMVLAPVFLLLRRPLIGGIGGAVRLARKAARWWTLWKLGSRMISHVPGFSRRR